MLDTDGHVVMMGLLAFLLGFRINQAYDRWWEGRTLWGEVIFSSRNLVSNAASVFTDLDRLRRLVLQTVTFAWALRSSLRGQKLGDDDADELIMDGLLTGEQIDWMNSFDHVPLAMIDQIRIEIKAEISAQMINNHGHIQGHWDLIIGNDILALLRAMTGCERINTTPMPFNYLTILRIFMVLWGLTYPLFIFGLFGWIALPLCIFILFILIKLEQMAGEMQEPFGFDTYDLALEEICTRIEQDLHEILLRAEGAEGHTQRDVRRSSITCPRVGGMSGKMPPTLPPNFAVPKSQSEYTGCSAATLF